MKHRAHNFLFVLSFAIILLACNEDESIVPVNKLMAIAGEDRQVQTGTEVILDGSASHDGNQKPFTYQWTFKSRPANSNALLMGQATVTPGFIPDVAGEYVIELMISQDVFFKTDQIVVTAIGSSPGEQTAIVLNQDVSTDLLLQDRFEDQAKPDYIVTENILVNAKLTINPGVVISFEADKSLHVYPQGALIARGTNTSRIIFTGQMKNKGHWKGILISSSNADNEMDNVVIEYAGSNAMTDMNGIKASVALAGNDYSGAALKVSNASFLEGGGYGLYIQGNASLNHFSANYFANNASSAAYVPARQLHKLDHHSHYSGNNGFNGVETSGVVEENSAVTWQYFNDGSKYFVSGNISIKSGVKILAGANIEFAEGVGIAIEDEGYLDAVGTASQQITFSAKSQIQNKYWRGIVFATGSELNRLHYTVISHAGFSPAPGINLKANVAVTASGKVSVFNSNIAHGLGWGIVADQGSFINQDVSTSNLFFDLASGNFKLPFSTGETTTLAGEWVDEWSFNNGHYAVNEFLYNQNSNAWFSGAADPWSMNVPGFGLKINEDGSYLWTIADKSPWTGECISYSAEYIRGHLDENGGELSFQENFWRSKFYTSCNPEGSSDINVQPGNMVLRYEITREYNMFTGAGYWVLKIINPDNSSFKYYKQ